MPSKESPSRRNFIKKTGAAVIGSAIPFSKALAAGSEPIDVMVVGSGFGGAVAALRLAEHGTRVVMLERGKRWPVTALQNTFSGMDNPDGRSSWLSDTVVVGDPKYIDKYTGVLQRIDGNGISVLAGAGVGGGSLVYNGVTYLPHRALFNRVFGQSVNYDEMKSAYYPRALEVLGASTIPTWMLERPEYAAAKAWFQLGKRAGMNARLIPETLDWKAVEDELRGHRVPSVIAGEFWFGNNSGAKLSLDKSYLKKAEDTGRLDIRTQHDVKAIQQGPDGRYLVIANQIDTNGAVMAERRFVVKKLFLSAGSVGTSKLLVRSKARGWLPALNEHVGKYWGSNGDFFSAITGLQQNIDPVQCGTAPVAIEDLSNPIDPIVLVCFADYFSKGNKGQITSIGMSTGPAKGSFAYDSASDDVILTWPANNPAVLRITAAATNTYQRLVDAYDGPGKIRFNPVKHGMATRRSHHNAQTTPVSAATCSHPVGGVVIDLATDNIGMLRNCEGLYVMDGALIPGNTGCANPSFTIAALAERNIERIIQRDF